MDVVVEFRMPGTARALADLAAPSSARSRVDHGWLQEAAIRCPLSGGQIRNAVLHASLAALDERHALHTVDLERALEREYRKIGTVCPLPRTAVAV